MRWPWSRRLHPLQDVLDTMDAIERTAPRAIVESREFVNGQLRTTYRIVQAPEDGWPVE
jgi:hypothetical protein